MDVVTHFGLSQDPFRNAEPGSLGDGALTREAARAYLAGRIAGAGGADLFSPAALDILADAADGDPDLLRRLGGNALFHAAFEGAQRVEDQHARQAAATQGREAVPASASPVVPAAAATSAASVHVIGAPSGGAEAIVPDPIVAHRRWWRRTPPMTRLAIVVGALLLSLPIVGYAIGVVKDSQASESSYLPEDSIVDEERIATAEVTPGGELVRTTDRAAAELTRPPVDLLPAATAARSPEPRPVSRPAPEPMPDTAIETEPEPALTPEAEPAPVEASPPPPPEIETVPIDPPAEPPVEETVPPTPQA
jgi:hypothetical protein